MELHLTEKVNRAIKLLNDNGFEAYAVGGCVRDMVMGIAPHDFDITTSALPEETEKVFGGYRIIETGIKHGTVTVIMENEPIEITTYRIDGDYLDNRHPESVNFSRNLKDDLSRRDFTVNTLCFNENDGLIDLFGGIDDIKSGIIRCVGEPDKRFNEDALRIMRAIRFSCTLGFNIEEGTAESIIRNRELLRHIAVERIREEFTKLLCGKSVMETVNKYRCVIEVFIPEYAALFGCEQNTPYHIYDVAGHSLVATDFIENDKDLRLTMFFHDIAKPVCRTTDENGTDHFKGHALTGEIMSRKILKRLRYDNKTVEKVSTLIKIHSAASPKSKAEAKFLLSNIGEDRYRDFMKVRRADCFAKANPHSHDEKLKNMQSFLDEIKKNNECYSLKQLAADGNDLKAVGITGGKINFVLKSLLSLVINGECENDREKLIAKAKELK